LVEEELSYTLGATALAIALVASKTFLLEYLFNKDGKGQVEVFKADKLHQVMDKFIRLSSPNV
jgi:divalent metal cation (Fe/Co/Zn/Cd) transporter